MPQMTEEEKQERVNAVADRLKIDPTFFDFITRLREDHGLENDVESVLQKLRETSGPAYRP